MSNAICVLGRDLKLYDASLLKIKYLVFIDLWNSFCKDIGSSQMRDDVLCNVRINIYRKDS